MRPFGLTPRGDVNRFVMLFPGRTGSTFLISALRGNPQVRATGELIGRLRSKGADAQQEAIRRWLRGRPLARERATGFKTKLVDVVDRDRFRDQLNEFDCRIIVLARENQVKHVVSRANAKRLKSLIGGYTRREGDEELPDAISIDVDEFDAALQRVIAHQTDIDDWSSQLDLRQLRLTYEDLLSNAQGTFDELCAFLEVDSVVMEGRTSKATPDNLREALANFDELRERYAGTPYESMFD